MERERCLLCECGNFPKMEKWESFTKGIFEFQIVCEECENKADVSNTEKGAWHNWNGK